MALLEKHILNSQHICSNDLEGVVGGPSRTSRSVLAVAGHVGSRDAIKASGVWPTDPKQDISKQTPHSNRDELYYHLSRNIPVLEKWYWAQDDQEAGDAQHEAHDYVETLCLFRNDSCI